MISFKGQQPGHRAFHQPEKHKVSTQNDKAKSGL